MSPLKRRIDEIHRRSPWQVSTRIRSGSLLACACSLALFFSDCTTPGAQNAPQVELTFLNVGQGDAIVIRSPEGKVALVDAGRGGDVARILWQGGIESVDIAIASHAHADHIGGMEGVLRAIPVAYYMDNGVPHTTSTYANLMRLLQASGVTYLQAVARTIELGSVTLRVLEPPPCDHLGFAVESRAAVDRIAELAREDGVLKLAPLDAGDVAGYLTMVRDPSGNTCEFSYGQALDPRIPPA